MVKKLFFFKNLNSNQLFGFQVKFSLSLVRVNYITILTSNAKVHNYPLCLFRLQRRLVGLGVMPGLCLPLFLSFFVYVS